MCSDRPVPGAARPLVIAAVLGLAGLSSPLVIAAPFVLSQTSDYVSTWHTETDEVIVEGSDEDSTDQPGVSVSSYATANCPGDQQSYCAVDPYPPPSDNARARTDYGSNRVRVEAAHYDTAGSVSHIHAAGATSTWSDLWTLGGNVTGNPDLLIAVHADGHWSNQGAFALQVLVIDGTEIQYGDAQLPLGTIGRGVMTNACGALDSGIVLDGCNAPPLPFPLPYESFVNTNPDNDDDGQFDHTLLVKAPWMAGHTYRIITTLYAGTGPAENSVLDAFSTAQVTQVLLPQGGTLTSAAGALANYNVSAVPLPAMGWLFAAVMAGVGLRGWRSKGR